MKPIFIIALFCVAALAARAQSSTGSFLWTITGKGQQQSSYLLLTSPTCLEKPNLAPHVQAALDASSQIVVENNLFDKSSAQKMRGSMMAVNDSQRLRQVFSASQYAEFVKKFKDEGAGNEAFDQLNAIRIDFLYLMRVGELSPCDPMVRTEKVEDALKAYSEKQKKRFDYLQSVEEVLAENARHGREYWQRNMWFAFKNEAAFRQTVERKNALYMAGDFAGLAALYRTAPLYQFQNSDEGSTQHAAELARRIDETIRKEPAFFQVNLASALIEKESIIDRLRALGYTLTPVQN